MGRQWKTAGGQSDMWDKTAPIEGTYIQMKSNVGPNSSKVYIVQQEDGSNLGIWGSTVLDGRFEEVPVGSFVRVEHKGTAKSAKGVEYADYEVQYDDSDVQAAPVPQAAPTPVVKADSNESVSAEVDALFDN